MPWYCLRKACIWSVVDALPKPNQVLAVRAKLVALASLIANAVVVVHGSEMPEGNRRTARSGSANSGGGRQHARPTA
jgi:hypothetical protein